MNRREALYLSQFEPQLIELCHSNPLVNAMTTRAVLTYQPPKAFLEQLVYALAEDLANATRAWEASARTTLPTIVACPECPKMAGVIRRV